MSYLLKVLYMKKQLIFNIVGIKSSHIWEHSQENL